MATSNYTSLVFDESGRPVSGQLTTGLGVVAYFYKDWIYVDDKSAWKEGGFVEPTIMEVREGVVRYRDLSIIAARGPQNGVYAVLCAQGRGDTPSKYIAGVACYAYRGMTYIDVKPQSKAHLAKLLKKWVRQHGIPEMPAILKALGVPA
jgi:hypothetical protein